MISYLNEEKNELAIKEEDNINNLAKVDERNEEYDI